MISAQQLDALDPQTRQAVQSLLAQVQQRDYEIAFKQALIDKLTRWQSSSGCGQAMQRIGEDVSEKLDAQRVNPVSGPVRSPPG